MISVDGLAVEFGGTALFSDISFVINEKDRIALMGKNGAGKSTLLKILAGARQPTRGKVSAPKDCVVAYLPQHLMTEDGRTVFDETAQAFSHLHEMEAQIEKLNKELETRTDYESDSYMALIEEVSALSEKFYSIDATNYEEDVEKALLGLGFTRSDFQRQTSDFSGGWRMRIELAKLLLQKPDVLLLDEPTNHLDIESIQWLEDFLINFSWQAAVVPILFGIVVTVLASMGSARSATAVTPLEALRPIELTDNRRSSLTRAIIGILMVVVGIAMAVFSIWQVQATNGGADSWY